jgi:hypothetical protein
MDSILIKLAKLFITAVLSIILIKILISIIPQLFGLTFILQFFPTSAALIGIILMFLIVIILIVSGIFLNVWIKAKSTDRLIYSVINIAVIVLFLLVLYFAAFKS